MTQKVNSKQLKEIYFNPPSSVRSFHEPSKYSKMRKSNHSILESKKHYLRYSEEEISRFENSFNKHYYHPNTEADIPISNKQENMDFLDVFEPLVTDKHLEKDFDSHFEPDTKTFTYNAEARATLDSAVASNVDSEEVSQISQLEKDSLEQSASKIEAFLEEPVVPYGTPQVIDQDENVVKRTEEEVDEEIVKSINDEKIDEVLDDDLIYLENLVSSGGNGIAATSLGSIGNLLDEIVDNEKNQISNYETDVFNANIQSLFDLDHEADLPPVPRSPFIPQFNSTPPIPPAPPVVENNEEVEDETIETEIKSSDDIKHIDPNDSSASEDLKVDASVIGAEIEPFNDSKNFDDHGVEKDTHDDFTDFIPDKQLKSEKSKLDLLDTVLVILLLIIVGILLFHFRYLLPFNLPFMNRI